MPSAFAAHRNFPKSMPRPRVGEITLPQIVEVADERAAGVLTPEPDVPIFVREQIRQSLAEMRQSVNENSVQAAEGVNAGMCQAHSRR